MIKDKKGNLPIHLAIQSGNIPLVLLLLQKNPDDQIHAPDGDGNRPLHLSISKGFSLK